MGYIFGDWIGLLAGENYLRFNILNRQPNITSAQLESKINIGRQITQKLQELADKKLVTLYNVGLENRDTMAEELLWIIESKIQEKW